MIPPPAPFEKLMLRKDSPKLWLSSSFPRRWSLIPPSRYNTYTTNPFICQENNKKYLITPVVGLKSRKLDILGKGKNSLPASQENYLLWFWRIVENHLTLLFSP